MKTTIITTTLTTLLTILPFNSKCLAQLQLINNPFQTDNAPNCYQHAMFENDLDDKEAFKLCANSDPAPSLCFTFARRLLPRENALLVCQKTPSMMTVINCIMEESKKHLINENRIVENCRVSEEIRNP